MNFDHYSMVIQWDSRDNIYVVTVPELPGCRTHGKTYNDAVKSVLEVIQLWITNAQKAGEPIPPPAITA